LDIKAHAKQSGFVSGINPKSLFKKFVRSKSHPNIFRLSIPPDDDMLY